MTNISEYLIKSARQLARSRSEFVYLVREGEQVAVATEFDLDTYHAGAPILAEIGPDGEMQELATY